MDIHMRKIYVHDSFGPCGAEKKEEKKATFPPQGWVRVMRSIKLLGYVQITLYYTIFPNKIT